MTVAQNSQLPRARRLTYLRQQDVKGQSERYDENREHRQHFNQRLEDFEEHHHVYPHLVEPLQEEEQVEPAQEHRQGCRGERQTLAYGPTEYGHCHYDGGDVQYPGHPVDGVHEVEVLLLVYLYQFSYGVDADVYQNCHGADDHDGVEVLVTVLFLEANRVSFVDSFCTASEWTLKLNQSKMYNLMISIEASWSNILNLKIYTNKQ